MAILQKLKSLLGFDDSESERGGTREVGVTVEREGTADDGTVADADRDETVDDASAGPTKSAATGSRTDDSTELSESTATAESADTSDESPVEEAEPDAATEPEPDTETADSELTPESAAAAEAEADTESGTADDTEFEPVDDTEFEPESAVESEAESEPETEAEPEETNPEPVVEIKGIGPAYADRLAGAGVDTVGELAAADAAELAEQTDISETRIQGWIDRAEVR
ncbi:DUF4332 domain-containing protein [Natrinema sp. DC36]|uniref:DUF4332 domain-containing protein n=1 Tax=Natrinema sp. DC36 TaxID=2878680 RepID=UPI001CEFF2B7|nr:DUF4332 domain-containing protein [Natrinema sp. DC36]